MNEDPKNQRKEIRIKGENLPEHLRTVSILLFREEIQVSVLDASLSGFGFATSKSADHFIVGTRLAIFPLGMDHAVYGKIIHVAVMDDGQTRVGLQLADSQSYQRYRQDLEKILPGLSQGPR